MDVMVSKKTSEPTKIADKRVQFCLKCLPGYRCKLCDRTFDDKTKRHSTSFHQFKVDFTAYAVKDSSTNMIADIGCPRTVIGAKDVERFVENLSKEQQDDLEILDVDENFKFGPSGPYPCFRKIRFPISTLSKNVIAEVAIVEADIPMLLGNNILEPLEAEIKLFASGNGVLKLKDIELKMKKTSGGHYTIRVADLSNISEKAFHSSQSVVCKDCECSFKTEEYLKKHKATEHGNFMKKIKCEVCDCFLKTERHLKEHIANQHRFAERTRFNCKGCDFTFDNGTDLEMHILELHESKQYTCEKCNFTTSSEDEYKHHNRTAHMKALKSILKSKEVSTIGMENEMSLEQTMNDLNTLLNGCKTRNESKLIYAVRRLVKTNQKYVAGMKEVEQSINEEQNISNIFHSHHTEVEDEDQDEIQIDGKVLDVFFCEGDDTKELTENDKKEVLKLHKYFAHRSGDKLWKNLFQPAGKLRGKKKLILDFLNKCEVCSKHRRTPPRPKVGLAKAKDVNEIVSMDLKILKKSGKKEIGILYIHDEFSKLIKGQVINDKNRDTIIQALENKWIIGGGLGPGHPTRGFFSDNGGEFLNEDLIDFAASLNISIKMTSASSPWSNGSCERAHATVDKIVEKMLEDDPKIGLQKAVDWACFVKNTEINKTGFSPM